MATVKVSISAKNQTTARIEADAPITIAEAFELAGVECLGSVLMEGVEYPLDFTLNAGTYSLFNAKKEVRGN